MNPFDPACIGYMPLSSRREKAIIGDIRRWLGKAAPPYPEGPGDDCAVLAPAKEKTLFTIDSVVYKRHFDDTISPEQAGAKLLKRNVSDIAAMGGRPDAAVVSVSCGGNLSCAWLEGFCRGLGESANQWSVRIVGGDLSGADNGVFSASMALLGKADNPILRKGSRQGDLIFVTGKLGGSLNGWHVDFVPRVREGQWLAQYARPSAMMDLTDGLAKDLPDLIPDGCDALLDIEKLPLRDAKLSYQNALSDGEDYELLFTLPADMQPKLAIWGNTFSNTPLACIGRIVSAVDSNHGKQLRAAKDGRPIVADGFSHF